MTIISQPNVTVNIIAANADVSNTPQKVLFVGQMLAAGSATERTLIENIGNSKSDINALFGAGSMIAEMILQAREINELVQFDAIPLDDNVTAVQKTLDISFTGAFTVAGTVQVVLGSERKYTIESSILAGDTTTEVAAKVSGAINLIDCPFSATPSLGVVEIEAKNGGEIANSIGVKAVIDGCAGLDVGLVNPVVGANDPSLIAVLDPVIGNRYQTIVWPYVDDVSEVVDFLDDRFNIDNDVLDGIAITTFVDTYSNLITAGNALNSKSLVVIGDVVETVDVTQSVKIAPAILEIPYAVSSQIAAIRSLRLTDGASISQYVISRAGALDSFGGAALASKPYFNTPLALLPTIDTGEGFSKTEIENLFDSGIMVLGNNISKTGVLMGEAVTTYKTDPASNPDVSFKFMNYVDTASGAREYFFNNLKSRFAQSRLTEGDLIAGREMANAELIAAVCTGLYSDLSGADFVLLQAGEDALKFFKQNLVVTLDLDVGQATIQMKVPLVTQLRTIIATMQIAFSTTG